MQVKTIESYSFFEFCRDVEKAILEGYRFDFDSNSNFPQQFGTLLVAGMLKVEHVKQEHSGELIGTADDFVQTEVVAEEKPVVKYGRKPRG